MLHIAEADEYMPPEAQKKIIAGLKPNPHSHDPAIPRWTMPSRGWGGKHYDKANADLANVRSQTFFRQHLS